MPENVEKLSSLSRIQALLLDQMAGIDEGAHNRDDYSAERGEAIASLAKQYAAIEKMRHEL